METGGTNIEHARRLVDEYSGRTGLTGKEGDRSVRYLWTDALAVQSMFGLSHLTGSHHYLDRALELMGTVHYHLGRFQREDSRSGWISGLSEEEGAKHPATGGLRIGKRLPERSPGEPVDEHLEWERDGQYFHYLTRWATTLLQATEETGTRRYADWAGELIQAGSRFIAGQGRNLRMYWKMSTDLSNPLVHSMGAHDPLDGLLCTLAVSSKMEEKPDWLDQVRRKFEILCEGRDWYTSDPLGIGGLMLDTVRSAVLMESGLKVPRPVHPEKLFLTALESLGGYLQSNADMQHPAGSRLAFRECGMTLGYRVISGFSDLLKGLQIPSDELQAFRPMVETIEQFWMEPANRQVESWTAHRNINDITLAASLIADEHPHAFTGIQAE